MSKANIPVYLSNSQDILSSKICPLIALSEIHAIVNNYIQPGNVKSERVKEITFNLWNCV